MKIQDVKVKHNATVNNERSQLMDEKHVQRIKKLDVKVFPFFSKFRKSKHGEEMQNKIKVKVEKM